MIRPIFLPFDEARLFNLDALHWWLMNPVATIHSVHNDGGWFEYPVYTRDSLQGYFYSFGQEHARRGRRERYRPWYVEWHDITNNITAEQMAREIYGAIPHCLNCGSEEVNYDPEEEGPLCFCGFECDDIYHYGEVRSS